MDRHVLVVIVVHDQHHHYGLVDHHHMRNDDVKAATFDHHQPRDRSCDDRCAYHATTSSHQLGSDDDPVKVTMAAIYVNVNGYENVVNANDHIEPTNQ